MKMGLNKREKKSASNQIGKRKSSLNGAKTSFTDLPSELLIDILSRVSVKSIFIFRSLCKYLYSILTGSDFVKLHFSRASTSVLLLKPDYAGHTASTALYLVELERDAHCRFCFNSNCVKCSSGSCCFDSTCNTCSSHRYKDHVNMKLSAAFMLPSNHLKKKKLKYWSSWRSRFSVVNSCNGFLCLWSSLSYQTDQLVRVSTAMHNDLIVINNPVTGEYSIIPLPEVDEFTVERSLRVLGLGFCTETSEYKVLIYVCNSSKNPSGYLYLRHINLIFTLGSGVWRSIEKGPDFLHDDHKSPSPVFLNGGLHWFLESSPKLGTLICFNLKDEKFQILPQQTRLKDPRSLCNFHDIVESINAELKGCLEFSSIKVLCDLFVVVYYGCSYSSLRRFMRLDPGRVREGICFQKRFSPIIYLNNGDMLMYDERNTLASYDGSNFRYFEIHGPPGLKAIRHVPSFCSLKEIMGDDAEVLNVRSRSASSKGKVRKVKPLILVEEEEPLFADK